MELLIERKSVFNNKYLKIINLMRYIVILLYCVLMQNATAQFKNPAKGLKVSTNGHLLEYSDGSPFFWMGDTAWELFHRLDDKETDFYL